MSRKNLSVDQVRQIIREEFALMRDEMNDSFKNEIADIKSKMCSIDAQLKHTLAIKETVEAVEKAVDYTSSRLDDIYKVSLPALTKHVEQVAVGLAMQTLDLDVHRRKWTLTIQGLKGPAVGERQEAEILKFNAPPYTLSWSCPSYSKFSQLSYEPGCSRELWCRKCATWIWNKYVLIFSKNLFHTHIQRHTAAAGTKCYKTLKMIFSRMPWCQELRKCKIGKSVSRHGCTAAPYIMHDF